MCILNLARSFWHEGVVQLLLLRNQKHYIMHFIFIIIFLDVGQPKYCMSDSFYLRAFGEVNNG